jgi:hypothetical protein
MAAEAALPIWPPNEAATRNDNKGKNRISKYITERSQDLNFRPSGRNVRARRAIFGPMLRTGQQGPPNLPGLTSPNHKHEL